MQSLRFTYGTLLVLALTASGCGNDQSQQPDAVPAGTPLVVVSGPRTSEAFYMTQTAGVRWSVTDDGASLVCDVLVTDGATTLAIAVDIAATSGVAMTTSWTLATVPPSDGYVAEVRCTDDSSPPLTGVGSSGVFAVTGPPQAVSYAAQIQPIWNIACITSACHDSVTPQARLNLTAAVSYAEIVGIASQQCPTTLLVTPGDPERSYLMFKLQGSGPCMTGSRMPKTSPAMSATQQRLIRDWITNGAPNN